MDQIELYDKAREMFDTPGEFDILFLGSSSTVRMHFAGVMRLSNGDIAYMITEDGTLFNWLLMISIKRVEES